MDNDFIRRSADAAGNEQVVDTEAASRKNPRAMASNVAWLRSQPVREGVLLLGGTDVDHFRIRYAQSRYRDDLAPSFWSLAGIVTRDGDLLTVPLDDIVATSRVPPTNGVRVMHLGDYDDAARFPNIAVLSFTNDAAGIVAAVRRIARSRAMVDFPSMMLHWLSYLWATDSSSNPLRGGIGLPSAVLVEAAHAAEGVHISPGQTTSSSAPEAIWQGARWWAGFYQEAAKTCKQAQQPRGSYLIRQWAAAARGVRDDFEGRAIQPRAPGRDDRWTHEWRPSGRRRGRSPLR